MLTLSGVASECTVPIAERAVSGSVLVATSYRLTISAGMCSDHGYEADELRALLRKARGRRRQTEIALAAKLSVGFYKRLESGRLQTARLVNLTRIADALGLGSGERAKLIALARPDLARMIERKSATAGSLLSSLRWLTLRLGRIRRRSVALRTTVELLHTSLAVDGMSFVFETRGTLGRRTGFSIGADLWSRACPPGFPSVTANLELTTMRRTGSGVQTLCACIRDEDVLVVLGFATTSGRELDPACGEFLETIAAVLEIRLRDRAVTARP